MFCCKSCGTTEPAYPRNAQTPPVAREFPALEEGHMFFLQAKFVEEGKRFLFDFEVKPSNDIALRLSACLNPHSLLRNACINGVWGIEESYLPSWFQLPTTGYFEVQICVSKDAFLVAFNCTHVISFAHRLPMESVNRVWTNGDFWKVIFSHVQFEKYPLRRGALPPVIPIRDPNYHPGWWTMCLGTESGDGEANVKMPFYGAFNEGCLETGWSINITGRVSPNPSIFKIAIQVDRSIFPQAVAAIQIEFLFNSKYDTQLRRNIRIVSVMHLNTFTDKKWGDQMIVGMETSLQGGEHFSLVIKHGPQAYHVHLNNAYVCDYPYILDPTTMNMCYIDGDIELIDVTNENT